jgi:RNA polymerase sigma-70 factor (ECF subfamily)
MREHDVLEHNPQVSRKALEALHGQLFGWALSRCGYDEAVAEDLMQQAYVEVLSGRARFDNKSTLKTFVFGIVQNLARSQFRQMAVRLRLINTYTNPDDDQHSSSDHADHSERQLIWKAVEALPQRQRDITELVFCRDMTIEEASQVMGITVGTGRAHYDRAKKSLADALAELRQKESNP